MSKTEPRGFPPDKQKCWIDAIDKEDRLRLNWFKKNEKALLESANKEIKKKVSDEMIEEKRQKTIERFMKVERHPVFKVEYVPPPVADTVLDIMKPVDPKTRKLLYTGTIKDGRVNYLKERYKTIPEDRFYTPECTSFVYGWNMWNANRNIRKTPFGRKLVIKESFYRRRGIHVDPEWYKEPVKLSPSIC